MYVRKMVEIVDPKLLKLPKKLYNTLRSFLDSSEKNEYAWNKGVRIDNSIVFTKSLRWRLIIYFVPQEKVVTSANLFSYDGEFILAMDMDKVVVGNSVISRDDEYLAAYYVISDEPVKFASPLALIDIITKLKKYIDATGMPLGIISNGVVYAET
jgi:hypothetical protein